MRKKKEESTFLVVCFSASVYLKVCLQVFCEVLGGINQFDVCFGFCSFFGHCPANTSVGKFKISLAIPK